MGKNKKPGFEYFVSKGIMREYQKKAPELRLKWLYMGNWLRKFYPKKLIKIQDGFRKV